MGQVGLSRTFLLLFDTCYVLVNLHLAKGKIYSSQVDPIFKLLPLSPSSAHLLFEPNFKVQAQSKAGLVVGRLRAIAALEHPIPVSFMDKEIAFHV